MSEKRVKEETAVDFAPLLKHAERIAQLVEKARLGKLPHSLLFTGPAGIGKALAARRLAARLLCGAPRPEACGRCPSCVQIRAGSHPDYRWIRLPAGKKQIGIEAVRALKQFVALRPLPGSCKLAVVEDAERLSLSAQNAILKTLEEPPPDAFIVLVTSHPSALAATVLSRCQRVRFAPLSDEEVAAVLRGCGEDDTEQIRRLVGLASGSPGRALRFRDSLDAATATAVENRLAVLRADRYGSVLRMSQALGRREEEMSIRLEWLLVRYRDAAVRAVDPNGGPRRATEEADGEIDSLVRRAREVQRALRLLRSRNPNRPLLAEAVSLRLAEI